jgi:hypothetical protein
MLQCALLKAVSRAWLVLFCVVGLAAFAAWIWWWLQQLLHQSLLQNSAFVELPVHYYV